MTWAVVAKKDFRDSIRAKTLWAIVAVFALLIAASVFVFSELFGGQEQAASQLLLSLMTPTSILLPAIGVMVGYKAIIGERNSGSIKILLSLPHSRRDAIAGKFVGRTAVVTVAVALGAIIGAVVFLVVAGTFAPVKYLAYVATSIVLGATFVSIAVGFSALTTSDTVAIIGGVGLVLLFTLLWNILTFLVGFLLGEYAGVAQQTTRDFIGFISAINPANAYSRLLRPLLGVETGDLPGGGAFFNEPWFSALIILVWLIAPLALGYWRFEQADL
ncbi:MAG: ABC transporter permease subunit [Halobacteriaceae archaeon]